MTIKKILKAKLTTEGTGVKLKRAFGYRDVPLFDPFLMLDFFGSEKPRDYLAGFPMHPHRGIETVTYMIEGSVEHTDSLGNSGTISTGDIQWMTAGSGIVHQEMPLRCEGTLRGIQLWVNLPKSEKMTAPRYRDLKAQFVPSVNEKNGTVVKIISGTYKGIKGAAQDITGDPLFLDVALPSGNVFKLDVDKSRKVLAFVFEGEGSFDPEDPRLASVAECVLFDRGEEIKCKAGTYGMRFILVSGTPLHEPVAWRGSIVMNTNEELDKAFEELVSGNFIKKQSKK